jgi:hypothetical protein
MISDKISRRVFKAYGAWQDEKEERWLRRMAREGWRLRDVNFMIYTFDRAEPADFVYRMDYQVLAKKDRAEYEGLFRAAGWELVCDFANWKYFRTPAEAGSNPDIFSDAESRLQKYRRLALALIAVLLVQNAWLIRILRGDGGPPLVVSILWTVLMAFWVYAIVRLLLRIQKLKRGAKK